MTRLSTPHNSTSHHSTLNSWLLKTGLLNSRLLNSRLLNSRLLNSQLFNSELSNSLLNSRLLNSQLLNSILNSRLSPLNFPLKLPKTAKLIQLTTTSLETMEISLQICELLLPRTLIHIYISSFIFFLFFFFFQASYSFLVHEARDRAWSREQHL